VTKFSLGGGDGGAGRKSDGVVGSDGGIGRRKRDILNKPMGQRPLNEEEDLRMGRKRFREILG
jgi:hypothetical protein